MPYTTCRSAIACLHMLLAMICLLVLAGGCTHGRVNMAAIERKFDSWVGNTKENEPGPAVEYITPMERLDALEELTERIDKMSPEEQQRVAAELAVTMPQEPDMLLRTRMLQALAKLPSPRAAEALHAASDSQQRDMRVAACEGWAVHQGPEATRVLSELLTEDPDHDVRMAAARALGKLKDPAAVTALATALEDKDPAMQYRAVESLEQVTGKELGKDATAWRTYLNGGTPAPPAETSVVSRMFQWF